MPDKVYAEILSEIERFRRDGFNRDDFERAKRVFYASCIRAFNSTEEIANEFLTFAFHGCDMLDYPEIVTSVTLDDIRRRFETITEDKIVLSKILPSD